MDRAPPIRPLALLAALELRAPQLQLADAILGIGPVRAQIHREADYPSYTANREHAQAQLRCLLRRAIALLNRRLVVLEHHVCQQTHGQSREIPEAVFDQLVDGEHVRQDVCRHDIREDFPVDRATHAGTQAEQPEGDRVGQHVLRAGAQGFGLGQAEEDEYQEGCTNRDREVRDSRRAMVGKAPRHEVEQDAAEEDAEGEPPSKGREDEGGLRASEARQLQPLREEGEHGPWSSSWCPLAQNEDEGRVFEERPHLRHILSEDTEE
mmetsp:Transcript_35845/g.114805  ORF Transcript_35845/g.114805 Transcript_35845/m.114805 type:complete len:266 (+) Transcript_35845:261-1058(+)